MTRPTLARLTLAMAAALSTLAAASAQAQSPAASETASNRALTHVRAHAQRTLHGADHSYAVRDVVIDADGTEHVRLERRFKGLRVLGGDLVTHTSRSGAFLDASHTLSREPRVDIVARLSPVDAVRAAMQQSRGAPDGSTPELLVYARGDQPVLAYDVRLYGEQEDGTPSELHVIIDALRGITIDAWDDIHTAPATGSGSGFFNGTVSLTTDLVSGTYNLRDPGRGNQYTVDMKNRQWGKGAIFTDADNAWGDGTLANRQTIGVDAQYGTAVTWDYYKLVHGRNGIANDGKGAYNRVHYGKKYNNAYWSDSCFCMTYGDGDGVSFNPFDSLDVAGHEMSHGLTSRTAGLVYSGESGGLNEGTSDIFGTAVEFYANNPNDPGDYLIGERIYKAAGKSLRNMIRPSSDGKSADCWYSNVGSLDVHYSSGVANHFFYLLAEGTSGGSPSPTCSAGDTRVATGAGSVSGIGRAKAEKIWFRALTVYMTSNTSYAGARAATISAANDLYGAGSPESTAVAAAWTAVGRN